LPHTWPLRVTEEDANRTAFYAAEVKARELRDSVASYDDYLAGLEQKLTIAPLTLQTLPRVAQLHLRTNQFNLTTERLGEAELGQFLDQADRLAVTGTVIDRFGDHGLVIAATVECDGPEASIRSFIMSCRVIGREVERAFLGALLDMLCSRGIREVTGLFKPTAKNAVSSRFYSESGFAYDETACGAERWRYSMTEGCTLPASRVVQISRSNLC
jgi:FkbH-like protein